MWDWLRKLFKRANAKLLPVQNTVPLQPRITSNTPLQDTSTIQEDYQTVGLFRPPHDIDELRKFAEQKRIANQNIERQKATLGYGLKGRNFRPRPAFEKKQWDLRKKPQEETMAN